jgi:nucleoside recognition membrane protein YjiH
MENENKSALIDEIQKPKVRPYGYVALVLGIIFFSGFLANVDSFIIFFDYTVLPGKFGALGEGVKNVQGSGGTGARDGFMYVFTVWPSVILALGIINVIEGLDGLKAGQRLLNPVLRPLLGIPGWSSLALISGLTASTDAGSALTLDLVNNNLINDKELGIFSCFNFVASGFIGSSLTLAGTYVPFLLDVGIPLAFILAMGVLAKFFAGNLMRVYIKVADKK